ncbi:C6 transcription factor [Fusarium beomiforme]|uniref:C6 transcription factor n=1 Tax=Fusarium beomiforme TaxID=44412 RepID=A0A9P5ABI0_9HYPO|nr:C6 transcription factor [Fusarium beomiforme]
MPQYSFPSVRASCDRCRFHKLKCIANAEDKSVPQKCARCIRAKVECVYSQRARPKRQKNLESDGSSGEGDAGPLTPPNGSNNTGEELNFDNFDSSYTGSPDIWAMLNTSDFGMQLEEPAMTFGNLAQTPSGVASASASGLHVGSMLDVMPNQILGNALITEPTTPKFDQNTALDASARMTPLMHDFGQSQTHGNVDGNGASPITQLSNLMADIYRTLAILTASSHANKYPSFNFCEYPIGTVLHLARTLVEVVPQVTGSFHTASAFAQDMAGVSRRDSISSVSPFNSYSYYADLQSVTPPSSTASSSKDSMDPPTKMLATSCYFSLRRLYCLVLTHFEAYLRMARPAFMGEFLSHNAAGVKALQLGELPLADELCSRLGTAVKLMLDALRSAEEMLGLSDYASTMRTCRKADPCGCPFSTGPAGRGQDLMPLAYEELSEAFNDHIMMGNEDNLVAKVESVKAMLKDRIDLRI